MKHIIFTLILALALTASAQYDDTGVDIEVDEFEGTQSCSQRVSHTRHPDYLSLFLYTDDDFGVFLYILRFSLDETVFNMFGAANGDEVLFRFANEDVVRFDVADTSADTDSNFDYTESTAVLVDEPFLRRLLTVDQDVRFRLSPDDGLNHDDTLPADFLNEFSEFLEECL